MPIETSWNPDTRAWTLTPAATFALEEVVALMRQTEWQSAARFIWNMGELVEGPATSGDLQTLIAEMKELIAQWRGSRVAIIATADLHFGIARMFMAFASDIDVEYGVFRDEPSATSWLLAA